MLQSLQCVGNSKLESLSYPFELALHTVEKVALQQTITVRTCSKLCDVIFHNIMVYSRFFRRASGSLVGSTIGPS
jgi:hypothetical protein